jgi:aldose 1-epimerase
MKSSGILPLALCGMIAAGICSCSNQTEQQLTKSGLDPQKFIATYDGDSTALYVLTNSNGMEACITNFGGRIVSLMVPDCNGEMRDVVLGFDSIQAYFPENNQSDFGAAIGRYANRINQGRIVLDADTFQLPQNNYGHCLHGGTNMGTKGWQYRMYTANQLNDSTLELRIVSPDGDNGFPGQVTATVTYTLTADNAIDIAYEATTDRKTIINLTNHSYFNLSGDANRPITDNILWVNADNYTPVDSTFMTYGTIDPVAGTPMDFTTPKAIGQDINSDFIQIQNGKGYDHNWVLNTNGDITQPALRVMAPTSGIVMEVFTNEPGVQIYAGNFLDGTVVGKGGIAYAQRTAVCFETQHYPDSPNKPQWPTTVLNPGETYTSHCIYRFSVDK